MLVGKYIVIQMGPKRALSSLTTLSVGGKYPLPLLATRSQMQALQVGHTETY